MQSGSSGPDGKESSVLFSLKGLLDLEEQRLEDAERERADAIAAKQAAEENAARQKLEAEQARLREEEQRREAEAARAHAEQQRLEGIRVAELEKVQREVAEKARLHEQTFQQEHAMKVASIAADSSKKSLKTGLILAGLATVAVIAGIIVYKVNSDAAAEAERIAKRADTEARLAELQQIEARAQAAAQAQAELAKAVEMAAQAGDNKVKEIEDAARAKEEAAAAAAKKASIGRKPRCKDPLDPLCN